MQITTFGVWRPAGALLLLAVSVTACTVDKQEAPGFIGPSGHSQTMTLTATPDRIAHDGQAQSVITVAMLDQNGQPLVGQRVSLGADTGSLSHIDVVTGTNGQAAFTVRAPSLSTPAESITVAATPFGSNADVAQMRTVKIALTGTPNTTAPDAAFTVSPEQPMAGTSAAFDASATTDEGGSCRTCAYTWTFGDGGSGTGSITTHTYASAGVYVATLTVVDSTGTVDQAVQAVTVIAAPAAGP